MQNTIDTEIRLIFGNVNDWLKFAEAKHAGLIALNCGILFGILNIYKDYHTYISKTELITSILLFIISILISTISLFPRKHKISRKCTNISDPNLYYAGHLSKLNVDSLKMELLQRNRSHVFNKFEEDILFQIIINSKIGTRKYNLFKFAIVFTSLGFIIPLISVLLL
jgi:hypothetical protein